MSNQTITGNLAVAGNTVITGSTNTGSLNSTQITNTGVLTNNGDANIVGTLWVDGDIKQLYGSISTISLNISSILSFTGDAVINFMFNTITYNISLEILSFISTISSNIQDQVSSILTTLTNMSYITTGNITNFLSNIQATTLTSTGSVSAGTGMTTGTSGEGSASAPINTLGSYFLHNRDGTTGSTYLVNNKGLAATAGGFVFQLYNSFNYLLYTPFTISGVGLGTFNQGLTVNGILTANNGLTVSAGTITLPTASIARASVVGTFMDLTSAQTAAGIKTFTNGLVVSTGGTITVPAGSISTASIAGTIMDLTSAQNVSGIKSFTSGLSTNNIQFNTASYTFPANYNYLGGTTTTTYASTTAVVNGTPNFAFTTTLNQGVYLVSYSLVLTNAVAASTISQMKHGLSYTSSVPIVAPFMQNSSYCYNYIPLGGTTTYTGSFAMGTANTGAIYLLFTAVWSGTGTLSLTPGTTTITTTRIA